MRSSLQEVFLGKDVLKICTKFRCSVNLQLIFRTPFPKNTPGGLLLDNEERKNHKTKPLAFIVRDGVKNL